MSASEAGAPVKSRWARAAVLAAFGLTLAGYLLLIDPDVLFTFWTDQTSFLVHGVAWAEGSGRHNIAFTSAPPDDVFRQSGFGLLLAPVILLRGLDIPLMKGVVILVFFLGLACHANMISRRGGGVMGWQAAVLAATAPFALCFSQLILSDLPFAGVSLIALWAFDRWGRDPGWAWLFVMLIAAYLATEFRITGAAVVLALMAALWLKPRAGVWPPIQRYAGLLSCFVILGGWPVYGYFTQGSAFFGSLGNEVQQLDAAGTAPEGGPFFWLLNRLDNLPAYLASLGRMFAPWAGGGMGAGLIGLASLPLCVAGMAMYWKKFRASHEYFVVFYLLVLLSWPFAEERYLLPLYPVIFVLALEGLHFLARRSPFRTLPHAPTLLFLFVLGGNLFMDFTRIVDTGPIHEGRSRFQQLPTDSAPWLIGAPPYPSLPVTDRFRMRPMNPARRDLLKLELWCRDHLAKTDKVGVNYESDFFLITGIQCGGGVRQPEPLSEYQGRTGINHLIVSEGLPVFTGIVNRWRQKEPGRFEEAVRVPGTKTVLYRLK